MITPSPTSKIASHLARGVVGAPVKDHFVLEVPNTSYQLHLVPTAPVNVAQGKRVVGVIRLQARRVDVVGTGGRYFEPVYGRPRRVQGTVVGVDASANSLTVNAGVPVVVTLTDERQQASSFAEGQLVSFDALDGATFTAEKA